MVARWVCVVFAALVGSVHSLAPQNVMFRGHRTSYLRAPASEDGKLPVVFVHGFGGCAEQWRCALAGDALSGANAYALDTDAYALDLLGFGESSKPVEDYSIDLWADQLLDFIRDVVPGKHAVVVGNSIGSLVCLSAARKDAEAVGGVALYNCAVGMNSKALPLDFAEFLYWPFPVIATPIFALLDLLLASPLARPFFDKVRQKATVRNVLENVVYEDPSRVDDDLVRMITAPSDDAGALKVFAAVFRGPPGARPERVVPEIDKKVPIAVFWGDADAITPIQGPVGKYFARLPEERANTTFLVLPSVGHCPFDDRPEVALPPLSRWLGTVS
mmetsp:Transcript_1912/g.5710  ORF Transcript_1912/g.5710 Transcript_1912/m.5710 type:complete len:331 (-) Transcript_1912:1874-2866(-)